MADLTVTGPAESAAVIGRVLAGEVGPARRVVLANTATALHLIGRASTLVEGVRLATEAIDCGAAAGILNRLRQLSGSSVN
jgi:anthranilate phosphoribosyltransferase